ncbi:mitogen-activated protein (MAP) kinase, ERK3/4 [Artemisia annua]|uniref:Mitogen-activated protein (MAP) kinase, ERK3/4 n=1 Tax=Artemisia annua TaxID=35608 RepID=A0A2U1QJ03_ARTAN|nr:mitogen-activated protein (MAP) kinase, ERK3/4 [Artemisia annua]
MDVEQVLEFLRKNGLSDSESALMDDIIEKSHLGSFHFQKFVFPVMNSSLPELKIPAASPALEEGDDGCSSSDDEFVSLGSSDFTNPYGIRTTRGVSSQASSDRLSQYGTARDYRDFDLQNDLNWYAERDEDYAMPPLFDNSDPFSGPTEDKFVMTTEKENQDENIQPFIDPFLDPFEQTNYLDKPWPLTLTSVGYVKDGVTVTDHYDLDRKCVEQDINSANVYSSFKDFQETDTGRKSDVCSFCLAENHRSCDCDLVERSKNTREPQNQMCEKDVEFDLNIGSEGSFGKNLHTNHELEASRAKEDSVIGSRYCVTEYLGSAAFSKVVQAHDLQMGIDVCLKIIKNDKDFFDQSLDEIKLLKFVNKYDPADERHILRLYDYFYFQEHLIIVCELLRANLYEYQKYNKECGEDAYFTLNRLKVITRQCLEALEYLHGLGIIHCDLKPENILIKSYSRCEIKVIDLGSSCFQNDNLSLYVQSRSYRAPEVIIGLPYDQKIDIWSLGCILSELYSGDVLFPNDALVILLARVVGMLGPIDIEMLENGQETDKYFTEDFNLYYIDEETGQMEYIIPQETSLEEHLQVSDALFLDFVKSLLEINPKNRPTAIEALQHPWLSSSK